MKSRIHHTLLALALLSTFTTFYVAQLSTVFAQGTAFTYQGWLNDGVGPATGLYDFRFDVYNDANAGGIQSTPVLVTLGVTNGLFTTTLNFGGNVFNGSARWLEINVRTNGAVDYATLAPRQPITATPYAVMAASASNLLGTVLVAQIAAAVITNNAAGLTLGGAFTGSLSGNADTATTAGSFTGSLSGDVTGTQSATVVSAVGGQSAASVASGASAANAATSAATPGRIVMRDATASFSATNLALNGSLTLPAAATVYAGGATILRADNHANFFSGQGAGNLTTTALNNTAVGSAALDAVTGGNHNTAVGVNALQNDTTGGANMASGGAALQNNLGGNNNTATGDSALNLNTNGNFNTAAGYGALFSNVSGSYNIGLGYEAGMNVIGSSNIDIGNQGFSSDTNLIRIGAGQTQTYIAGNINGNGGGLTNLNAVQLTGTISAAQLPGVVVTNNNATSVTLSGSFTGNGSGLTSLNANNLASGTVPLARLSGITSNQLDAVTWQLATNLNGGNAALASNVVSGIAITNAFITNSVFAGNGSGLTNVPGTLLAIYTVPVGGGNVANAPATTWTKVVDLGSFTKQNGTMLELTFNGRLVVGSWAGGTGGADFELRLDNTASSVGRVRATVMSTDNANFGIQAGMTGFFTGYSAGSHTVSMWVYSYAGGITNIAVNPGYYSAAHVAIKEFK